MLQAQFIAHVTVAGERWDLLAWTYYGDASLYSPIIMANPTIAVGHHVRSGPPNCDTTPTGEPECYNQFATVEAEPMTKHGSIRERGVEPRKNAL